MGVTLSGAMPAEEVNGLEAIEDGLLEDPTGERIAIVRFSVSKIVNNLDKGDTYPVVRLAQIEPVSGEQGDAARELLKAAYFARTGATTLDFDGLDDEELDLGEDEEGDDA